MIGFLKVVVFLILFLLIIKLFRLISRYWSSSKPTIDDVNQHQKKSADRFENAEDAKFREIDPEEKEKSDKE